MWGHSFTPNQRTKPPDGNEERIFYPTKKGIEVKAECVEDLMATLKTASKMKKN